MIKKEVKILKNGSRVIITKKRKLKTRYKVMMVLCYLLISFLAVKSYFKGVDEMLNTCDQYKGSTCSYYEAELLAKRGEI